MLVTKRFRLKAKIKLKFSWSWTQSKSDILNTKNKAEIVEWTERLCSHVLPEHGAWVRFSLDANVNTPFFQVLTSEFGHSAPALYSCTYIWTQYYFEQVTRH